MFRCYWFYIPIVYGLKISAVKTRPELKLKKAHLFLPLPVRVLLHILFHNKVSIGSVDVDGLALRYKLKILSTILTSWAIKVVTNQTLELHSSKSNMLGIYMHTELLVEQLLLLLLLVNFQTRVRDMFVRRECDSSRITFSLKSLSRLPHRNPKRRLWSHVEGRLDIPQIP